MFLEIDLTGPVLAALRIRGEGFRLSDRWISRGENGALSIAIGLTAYGVYTLIESRYRRLAT